MEKTEHQMNLLKIMKKKGYNAETTAAIVTFMKQESEAERMSSWITNNPQDNQEALNEMGRILRMRKTNLQ